MYENNHHKFSHSSKRFFLEKTIHLKPPSNPPELTGDIQIGDRGVRVLWQYDPLVETEGFIIYYRKRKDTGSFKEVGGIN